MNSFIIVFFLCFCNYHFHGNLIQSDYSIRFPYQSIHHQEDNYDEGKIDFFSFSDGGIIIITQGHLLTLPVDELIPLDNTDVSVKGVHNGNYWRRDLYDNHVRVYYQNVPPINKKRYDRSLKSIIAVPR